MHTHANFDSSETLWLELLLLFGTSFSTRMVMARRPPLMWSVSVSPWCLS